jgi:hypothetical protein
MPQSLYPLDLRATSITHIGNDVYGTIGLKRLGSLSYTAYVGRIPNDSHGGYQYGLRDFNIHLSDFSGHGEGGDLRWNTPVQGLLAGVSFLNKNIHATGITLPGENPHHEQSRKNETSQFFLQYERGPFQFDTEYAQGTADQQFVDGPSPLGLPLPPYLSLVPFNLTFTSRGFYGAASYRFTRWLQVGSYFSGFFEKSPTVASPNANIRDKTVTARFDVNNHWDFKVEGHFINGYGGGVAVHGFYTTDNPLGFQKITNMLIIRTGFEF